KADGSFRTRILASGDADEVAVQVLDSQGKKFGKTIRQKLTDDSVWIQQQYKHPRLWSAEFPNRYRAVYTLYKKGKQVHTKTENFGSRTVEVKERDGVDVNGKKIKFTG